jgi:assimilatory nitrate reductase catalytic subunit
VCGYCSTGCNLNIHIKGGDAVNLSPDPDYPVNLGMACPKGWEAMTPLKADDRGTTPLLRNPRTGVMDPVDWPTAARVFCERFREVQRRHGFEAAAFVSTGQMTTEEMTFLGAFAKFGMGMIHGDGNTRQCMATAVAAYKESFGFDAPPYTYADFEQSDVLVFWGANPCIAHPILWQRVLRNRNHPEIVVVDPRRTETAMHASQHLALKPKSDLALLNGVAHILIREGWVDRAFIAAHTSGFESYRDAVRVYTPDRVVSETGISLEALLRFARTIHEGGATSFWWTMGVNQGHEATRTAQAIIHLALLTGNIGRPGTGANSITGQCNAMGSRLFSNTTNLIGGHDVTLLEHRKKVASATGIPIDRLLIRPSWAYDQILSGIDDGTIRGLWCIATNPAHSWIDSKSFARRREKLEFLVVQDMYPSTETAQMADLYLPAAGWGEKEGTFINSERRIGYIQKVARAPGMALSDFQIFRLLSHVWDASGMFDAWATPEAVFRIMQRCSRNQPCDITGIRGYAQLRECGGIQWPWTESDAAGGSDPVVERRLFEDRQFYTKDKRARFVYSESFPPPEIPNEAFPFTFLTGRGSSAQWHTNTRTGKSGVLQRLYSSECYVEVHPTDAQTLGIAPNDRVRIHSRRGTVEALAFVTPTVSVGQIFMPMHYPEANRLTLAVFDPQSRQPSYKHCAVRIEPLPSDRQLPAGKNATYSHP